jgi:hypothetical protein
MNATRPSPLLPDIAYLRHQVGQAVDRIIESDTAKILTWNGEKLVPTSINAKRAAKALNKPTCLGVYDFDSTMELILGDLLTVIQHSESQSC